jgi:glycine cleavage system regulatory protein
MVRVVGNQVSHVLEGLRTILEAAQVNMLDTARRVDTEGNSDWFGMAVAVELPVHLDTVPTANYHQAVA